MITITQSGDVVTMINVFTCEPANQQALIDAWIRAREDTLGQLPIITSESKDGTRVDNYAQWKTSENWQNLIEIGKSSYFAEMGKVAKPNAHLYEVCHLPDQTADSTAVCRAAPGRLNMRVQRTRRRRAAR